MARLGAHYITYRLGDWFAILFLVVSYIIIYFIEPHHRYLFPGLSSSAYSPPLTITYPVGSGPDPSLNYPLNSQTVNAPLLFFLAVGLPLLVFALFYWLRRSLPHNSAECQNLLLAFFLCIILTLITTDSIKKIAGRPRPNFYQMVKWNQQQQQPEDETSIADIREAYQSFVSGHSSLSFAGLLFLSQFLFQHLSSLSPLHIAQQLVIDKTPVSQLTRINNLPSLFIPFLPIVLATWIALTRIIDYWHFCEDVVGGMLVGVFFAYICFTYCYLERKWTWLQLHPLPGFDPAQTTAIEIEQRNNDLQQPLILESTINSSSSNYSSPEQRI